MIEGLSPEEVQRVLAELPAAKKVELYRLLHDKQIAQARDRFLPFIRTINPNFAQGRHHEVIAEKLEAVERGELRRLMVFMPPRASKSFMISEFYPAWYLGRQPTKQVLAVSYAQPMAMAFGRKVRNLVGSDDYREIFPGTTLAPDSRAADRWHTGQGGVYNAAGIGSGIAGKGANLGLIDDPMDEQDAPSKAARKEVIDWWPWGFTSRAMPDAAFIILMTRWHQDDLAGHLLAEAERSEFKDQWEVVDIPALLDERWAKVFGYKPGSSFWPVAPDTPPACELKGWPTEDLLRKKANMPPYQWNALYMQRPSTEGGNILKREYWKMWEPAHPPKCDYYFMSLDTAFSTKDSADYSVITQWGVFTDEFTGGVPHLIALAAERGRWPYYELKKRTEAFYEKYMPDVILVEKKASGQSLIQDLQLQGLPVHPYNPDRDKEARAWASQPLFEAGRVWIPRDKGWAEDIMNECTGFPHAAHDDYVDAVTQAVLWVKNGYFVSHPLDRMPAMPNDNDPPPTTRKQSYW